MIQHSGPWITEDDLTAARNVLLTGMIAKWNITEEFGKAISKHVGAGDCVACGSGTAALQLALLALNIGKGDEVILPTYVCQSVADAVMSTGATPIFCDVGGLWNMEPENVEKKISSSTKAIIIVHIYGIYADTPSFKKYRIPLIEDFCQCFGPKNNPATKATGDVSFYSFHATKCLTTGEGGAISSNNADLMRTIKGIFSRNAVASPMTDIQSALGLSQLNRYETFIRRREDIANFYFNDFPKYLTESIASVRHKSMFFRFPLRFPSKIDFEKIRNQFERDGIAVRRGVDELLHRRFGLSDNEFPNAVKCFDETLSIPILPFLKENDLERIVRGVEKYATL